MKWIQGESVEEARKRWKDEQMQEKILRKDREKEEIEREKYEVEDFIVGSPVILTPPMPIIMPLPMKYIPGDKKLSILICSVTDRKVSLNILLKELKKQATEDVEILVEVDDRKITTGAKRNILLKRARGDYVCFVDDDDMVSDDYITKILEAIKTKADCCSLTGQIRRRIAHRMSHKKMLRRGTKFIRGEAGEIITNIFIHSLRYKAWFERRGIYYRCPNHLNTVKRELALLVGFPDISQGEDKAYSSKLLTLLKTEATIKGTIYFYDCL